MSIPAGMTQDTYNYLLAFTVAHEGPTNFMYNNWPLKNPNKDVTAGVGLALNNEAAAVRQEVRSLFRVKLTGLPATDDDMRQEFRRVFNLARTKDNLLTDYRDKSLLIIPIEAMNSMLDKKMLEFWEGRGKTIQNFARLPAQAQVALMSWNYGLRLSGAPLMCEAVEEGTGDGFTRAAKESFIRGWDDHKNEGHKRLFLNAAAIVREGLAASTLPPLSQCTPPPAVHPSVLAASVAGQPLGQQLAGHWDVRIGAWPGLFLFDARGGVSWMETRATQKHPGRWTSTSTRLEWKFNDPGDFRTFTVPLPLSFAAVSGTILPAGQGWFTMTKKN